MTGMEKIRECMTAFLTARGVKSVTAWESGARRRSDGAVAAVSLKSCSGGPSGFRDYLGERYDAVSGKWQELYGKRIRAVFGLDLYAPKNEGEGGCQNAFDRIAEAFQNGGPEGLSLVEFSRGSAAFDQGTGLFHCPAEAVCEAWLYAVADEGGAFMDFKVKGELNG